MSACCTVNLHLGMCSKWLHALLQGSFSYGGMEYELLPAPEGASAEACGKLVQLVLKQNEPCGAEQVLHEHIILMSCRLLS